MDINMAYDGLDDIGFAYSTGDTFSDDHLNTAENLSGNVTKDTVQQSLPHVSSGSVSSYQSASPTERVGFVNNVKAFGFFKSISVMPTVKLRLSITHISS
ncbi:unnamed protein product [Schistosoma mattheei]|uniref:Uncharacterized protein n=2 Tax=Schistosoma TaxID=6181 RepID=A0A183PHN6_9TREM|nr:unnamed protein product [Schistosoma mattheei]